VSSEARPSPPQQHEHGAPVHGAPRASYFGAVTRALNLIGTLLILVMAVAVNADVIGRDFFNHPIPGVLEFVGLSIVAVVFLQMANTLREDRHVSNDMLMQLVARRRPQLAAAIYVVFDLIGASLMTFIVVYVWPLLMIDYRGGYYSGTAGVVEIPLWPFKAVVIVGASVTALQFLALARRHFLQARRREQV
jgi:TRAP-type mannitol/chloroaromatic compound transport system permease small subunit